MTRWSLVSTMLVAASLVAAGCNKPKSDEKEKSPPKAEPKKDGEAKGDAHTDEPEHEGIPKRIRLPANVIRDARVNTVAVVRESLDITIALPGELIADPDRSASVSTPIPGRLDRVAFKEGSIVKKGDLLALVRVPELGKVRSAQAATAAKASAARANAQRLATLADKKLASVQEAVSAKAEAEALEVEARALSEQLGAMGTGEGAVGPQLALRAPIAGVIVSRDAVVGQPVAAEQTIATIADLDELWFMARLFEKDLGRVKLGSKAEVQLNAYPKERFDGSIDYIAQKIDVTARTVTARIKLQNRSQLLRIGLFGSARVSTGEANQRPPQLVVPRTAVIEIGGKPVVFVRQADEDYELHDIVLGEAALGKVEVLNGLRDGEQVVSEGAFTLKSVALKSTLAEED